MTEKVTINIVKILGLSHSYLKKTIRSEKMMSKMF